jgi:hypothetical protein
MLRGAALVGSGFRVLVLALASVAACSQKAPLPAQLGDCDSGKGCGTTTGGQGSGGPVTDSGGVSCGTITYPDPTCNACIQDMCCDRNAACSASSDCLALIACDSACAATDMTCKNACRDRWQNVIALFDNFIFCRDASCPTDCVMSDAGTSCGLITFATPACDTCMNANCCTQNATCSNNPDCFGLVSCAAPCPPTDQQCRSDCIAQHPNGSVDFTSLNQCGLTSCSTQCQ